MERPEMRGDGVRQGDAELGWIEARQDENPDQYQSRGLDEKNTIFVFNVISVGRGLLLFYDSEGCELGHCFCILTLGPATPSPYIL